MNFSKFKTLIFFAALGITSIIFLYLIKPFFYPLFWAAVIAGIFYPIWKKINAKIKYPNISSLLTILLVFVIICIPIAILSSLVLKESLNLYASISSNEGPIVNTVNGVFGWIKNNPITEKLNIDEQQVTAKLTEVATAATNYVFTLAKNFTQNSLTFVVMFIFMLYTLFFFLRDGQRMLKRLRHLSPLGDEHENLMYKKFTSTARAVLKGTLIIGVVQGTLTGLLFYIVGIEGALIWAIITTLCSIIPGFGSYVIWVPAALIMFALGNIWQGVLIILVGALLISTIDNFLRPVLVGKDTQMHPLLILFSTLGGLVMFGISGFIIGPIITALLLSLWEIYEKAYHTQLNED